nr:MAG TPA: minor structural protein [Caudoviricetes sp.]
MSTHRSAGSGLRTVRRLTPCKGVRPMYNAFLTAALTAAVSTVVGSAVSAVIASLIARKKSKKAIDEVNSARYAAIENGLQSMLRAEIIRQHDKHTERRYCPLYAKEAMVKVYDAYHALGGNGMMTRFYNEIIALPEEPQQKED